MYNPTSGDIIGADNQAHNVVDLLGGGTPVNDQQYDITQYAPHGGGLIGSDNRLYNLVQLLQDLEISGGGGGGGDENNVHVVNTLPQTGEQDHVYITGSGIYVYNNGFEPVEQSETKSYIDALVANLVSYTQNETTGKRDIDLTDEGDIILGNNRKIFGRDIDGAEHNIAELSLWNVVDIGSSGDHTNLNSIDRPTVQLPGESGAGAHGIAYLDDATTFSVPSLPDDPVDGKTYILKEGIYKYVDDDYVLIAGQGIPEYGAIWDGSSSPILNRTGDAAGATVIPQVGNISTQNDFDQFYPWSEIYRCNLNNAGYIVAREGEPNFSPTGDVAPYAYKLPVMLRIPKFYYKVVFSPPGREWRICQTEFNGYSVHPAFVRPDGSEASEIFLGAYLAGIETVDSTVMLTSASGQDACVLQSRDYFRQRARVRGTGWQQMDFVSYNALTLLYAIEFASLDSQAALGGSISGYRYNAADKATVATVSGNTFICANATADYFDVGQQIGIGTSNGNNSVAHPRTITAKASYNASNTTITFDGAPVSVAVDNVIWSCAQKSGRADTLAGASGREAGTTTTKCQCSYRGYEGIGGNAYTNIDGVNIGARTWYLCTNPDQYNDTQFSTANGYVNIGTAPDTNGYLTNFMFSNAAPWAFAPGAVGGGSTTYIPDYYYQSTGDYALRVGGSAHDGAHCGAWCWHALYAASIASWYFGGRLLFRSPT